MQSSEVISVNIWQMIISILNLLILFAILKKFLFKPVQSMLAQRQQIIDDNFKNAKAAEEDAKKSKALYEKKLGEADEEAEKIVKEARKKAEKKSDRIVQNAKDKADGIVNQARADAKLEMSKAQSEIKHEIIEVSALISEKILEREINADDHKKLIDSFIENLGDEYDGNE